MLDNLLNLSFFDKSATFSVVDICVALALSFAVGLFIFVIYKKTFRGVMYSTSFGVSLIAMNLITAFVILAVTSNLVVSLGMVGALSIVRFRTVVKEPLDIAFLFWSISAGIVVGVGLIPLAVIGSLFIGIILLIFINHKTNDAPYILILSCAGDSAETEAIALITTQTKKCVIKSKAVSENGIELTVEVRLLDAKASVVNDLSKLAGVSNAVLVSYNGDYM
jgi:uncharacterized membrane protein YhiD involved in acid resistance